MTLDKKNIPNHIAIIMDGNRRWAKRSNKSFYSGYKKGADNLKKILKASIELGVKTLTVYAFSTENWSRSDDEVKSLMLLFERYLERNVDEFKKEGARLRVIGNIKKCSESLKRALREAERKTSSCRTIDLVLAISYGGRDEIKRVFIRMLEDYRDKKIERGKITEDLISSYMDTSFCKDPDLVIRTSGERRISNFLIWQVSYSELVFSDLMWPEFTKKDFLEAILQYQKKNRRFGGV